MDEINYSSGIDMIYKLNKQGYFTFVNEATAKFFKSSQNKIIGKHFTDLVREDWREKTYRFYESQLNEKISSTYLEFPVIELEGTQKWVGQSAELFEKANGEIEFYGVARDITQKKETETELQKSHLRIASLIRNLNSAILVESEERTIVYVNQKFCDFFGIPASPDQLIGMDCSESAEQSKHHFKNPEGFVDGVNELLKNRNEKNDEVMHFADGRVMERDYIPLFLDNKYSGHLWQYRDVTKRVKIQQRIRESEERYRRIIENINLGLLQVDLNQKIEYANESFCNMVGYSANELYGQRADAVFITNKNKKEEKELVEEVNNQRASGKSSAYEIRVTKKDGEVVWLMISGTPLYDAKGNVIGSLGIHLDISERKKKELERKYLLAQISERNEELTVNQEFLENVIREKESTQKELEESETKVRTILNSAMDAHITINQEGLVVDWNKMAQDTFGFSHEETLGKLLSDLIIPAKYKDAHDRGMEHFLKTGEGPVLNSRIEIVGQHKSGRSFPIELSIVPIKLEEGYIFSAFLRDITKRKESEEEMLEALEQQKKLGQMRSRFVSMTSHELRTPLTTIKSSVDLLAHQIDTSGSAEKQQKYIGRINTELDKLKSLMSDILTLGKAEVGKLDFRPTPTDLLDFCSDIIERHYKPWKDNRNANMTLKGSPRLVRVDTHIMQHAITNLLSNAFKYSPNKEAPELELNYLDEHLEIKVSDHGIGIPKDDQSEIFSSFFRATNSIDFEGTGMGLAIVKQYIDIHQGQINFKSTEGRGTTFTITLKYLTA